MDGIKVKVNNASSAKNASAVNKRRLQSSTTLNRRFVKKPTPAPRIKASAGAASRTLKAQSQKKVLISKGQGVRLKPVAKQTQQTQPAASYCPFCGQAVPAGAKFCPFCGKEL